MTEHLIGLSQDHLAPILERVRNRLLEKGVAYEFSPELEREVFRGIGNGYIAWLDPEPLTEQPSPEQAEQMVADMVLSVEQGLLQRRSEISE